MKALHKIALLFHTLRYLKFKQIYYQAYYRLSKMVKVEVSKLALHPENIGSLKLEACIPKPESYAKNGFTFLNLGKEYPSIQSIHWDEPAFGKLWTYNLNYFDYLLQREMDTQTGNNLIEDFINRYNILLNAREPYTISLRGINWIKWLSRHQSQSIDKLAVDNSLWQQYQQLSSNIEYHLLGNHLLENGFSLLFGSFYFSDPKLYSKARKILKDELKEQVLPDGAHYELSPMYHQIILDRMLDCINLMQNNKRFPDQDDLLELMNSKASVMLGWLKNITFSGGDIPMVNDFASGIAPTTGELIAYAESLKIKTNETALNESGYRTYKKPSFELMVDYGIPGPDYIPGHAHADIFNFVLYVQGKPVIVDTGISTYNVCETRLKERSTSAHNAVMVNGTEQSEVWSAFRMGRRVKPTITSDTTTGIKGQYKGLGSYSHEREFMVEEAGCKIIDNLSGSVKEAMAFLHFMPGTDVQVNNDIITLADCKIIVSGAKSIFAERYEFAEGFNLRKEAPMIRIAFERKLEVEIKIQTSPLPLS